MTKLARRPSLIWVTFPVFLRLACTLRAAERERIVNAQQGATRDKLAALLWGERGDEQARGSQPRLVALPRALADTHPPPLRIEGQILTLDADGVEVGAGTPGARARQGRLRAVPRERKARGRDPKGPRGSSAASGHRHADILHRCGRTQRLRDEGDPAGRRPAVCGVQGRDRSAARSVEVRRRTVVIVSSRQHPGAGMRRGAATTAFRSTEAEAARGPRMRPRGGSPPHDLSAGRLTLRDDHGGRLGCGVVAGVRGSVGDRVDPPVPLSASLRAEHERASVGGRTLDIPLPCPRRPGRCPGSLLVIEISFTVGFGSQVSLTVIVAVIGISL